MTRLGCMALHHAVRNMFPSLSMISSITQPTVTSYKYNTGWLPSLFLLIVLCALYRLHCVACAVPDFILLALAVVG